MFWWYSFGLHIQSFVRASNLITFDFVPLAKDPPILQGRRSISALFWTPKKAGAGRSLVMSIPLIGDYWGKQGLRSNSALFWAPKIFVPFAPRRTCGPRLILPPAVKRWGSPWRERLCSHLAHLWATFDSAP